MGKRNKQKSKHNRGITSPHIWCPQCLEGHLIIEVDTWINREYKLRVTDGRIRHDKKPVFQHQQVEFTLTCDNCQFKDTDSETKEDMYAAIAPLLGDGWYTSEYPPKEPPKKTEEGDHGPSICGKAAIAQLIHRQEAEDVFAGSVS